MVHFKDSFGYTALNTILAFRTENEVKAEGQVISL